MYSKHMHHRQSGFTLVEILTVVIIIAIISGIGIVAYQTLTKDANRQQARSMMQTIGSALKKYYAKNNEYPSADSLAGGGNGRSLSAAQYTTIASTLGVKPSVLQQGKYKFVPCSVSNAPCTPSDSTDAYSILYLTRSATDIASNVARVYNAPVSGCTYTIPASTTTFDAGYSSYMLMFKDASDTNWWTVWNTNTDGYPRTIQGLWCPITRD